MRIGTLIQQHEGDKPIPTNLRDLYILEQQEDETGIKPIDRLYDETLATLPNHNANFRN